MQEAQREIGKKVFAYRKSSKRVIFRSIPAKL